MREIAPGIPIQHQGEYQSDVAANKPVTADTLFRIGSVSKAFAALAALQLQEEGKLHLT